MAQNIDTYFKEKLQTREFDLKEAYWEQAAAMLDAEEKKKKRGIVFWLFGSALGLGFLALAVVLISSPSTDTTPDIYYSNNISKELKASNLDKKNEATIEAKSVQPPIQINEPVTASVFAAPVKKAAIPVDKQSPSQGLAPTIPLESATFIPEPETTVPSIAPPLKRLQAEQLEELDLLPITVVSIEEEEKNKIGFKKASGCLEPSPFHIGVTASQLMQVLPKSGENLITGFHGGVVLQYDLNKRWFLSSGVGYSIRTGHFDASKMTETRNYRFGLELMENQLKPSSLHYVTVPVQIGWKKGHHLMEAGIYMDYLTGVRGEIGKIERIGGDEPRKDFVAQEKGWIDDDGFTKFNVSPSIGYRYRVNKAFSFGVNAQFAIRPLTQGTPQTGDYILKEDDRLNLRLQAVYLLK